MREFRSYGSVRGALSNEVPTAIFPLLKFGQALLDEARIWLNLDLAVRQEAGAILPEEDRSG
jgi:hypothetical protein